MNKKIKIGIIGLGPRGMGLLRSSVLPLCGEELELAVLCDSYSDRLEEAAKEAEEIFDRWADRVDEEDEDDYEPDEYFSDYSLKIETEAQKPSSFVWAKATVGPMYFKVGNQEKVQVTVSLTKKENVKAEGTVKTYTLSPADALKLTLKPVVNNGNLGISITIEETTVDHPVDIVIPGDWV